MITIIITACRYWYQEVLWYCSRPQFPETHIMSCMWSHVHCPRQEVMLLIHYTVMSLRASPHDWRTGPWFNIKMSSYQYMKSHCGDKTVIRSSYLHNGISYTGKMASSYWTNPLDIVQPSNSRRGRLGFSYVQTTFWSSIWIFHVAFFPCLRYCSLKHVKGPWKCM